MYLYNSRTYIRYNLASHYFVEQVVIFFALHKKNLLKIMNIELDMYLHLSLWAMMCRLFFTMLQLFVPHENRWKLFDKCSFIATTILWKLFENNYSRVWNKRKGYVYQFLDFFPTVYTLFPIVPWCNFWIHLHKICC